MANKFKEKQIMAEILNELYNVVDKKEEDCRQEYRKIGVTDEQAKHWKTGELLWEDAEKTIPKMVDVWDYVMKSDEEMSEDDYVRIKVCQYIKSQLEKMI